MRGQLGRTEGNTDDKTALGPELSSTTATAIGNCHHGLMEQVARFYGGPGGLVQAVRTALQEAGLDPGRLRPDDLAPLDEFHIRGRAASMEIVAALAVTPDSHVLDLGSGAGLDAFLAAAAVGETGYVIGVDMTPAMVSRARANAEKSGRSNVEFRLGEIERLPVADGVVDVIISNCVINLSPDKPAVFRESFRVLREGGRLAVSDVVASVELPEEVRGDLALYSGCVAGASLVAQLEEMMAAAGFVDIRIAPKAESKTFIEQWAPGRQIADYVVSATIEAVKPRATQRPR